MRFPKTIVVALCSFALAISAVPASASTTSSSATTARVVTSAQVNTAFRELTASRFPRTIKTVAGERVETFTLPGGTKLSFPLSSASRVNPAISGGNSPTRGLYIELNRVDQGAIAVGAAAGIAAGICAIPAVGWVVCGIVATIVAIASYYIAAYGVCPSKKPNLRIYVNTRYSPICTTG